MSIRWRLLDRGLRAMVSLYRIPLTANHLRLRLERAHEHRAWQADCHQDVLLNKSYLNFFNYDCRVRIKLYAGLCAYQSALLNVMKMYYIMKEHPELWSGLLFRITDDTICYELRAISLATDTSINAKDGSCSLSSKHLSAA